MQILEAIAAVVSHWRLMDAVRPTLSAFDIRRLISKERLLLYKSTFLSPAPRQDAAAQWTTSIVAIMTDIAPLTQQPILQSLLQLYEPSSDLHAAASLLLSAVMGTPSGRQQLNKEAALPLEVGCIAYILVANGD